jgi:hypothetical protein
MLVRLLVEAACSTDLHVMHQAAAHPYGGSSSTAMDSWSAADSDQLATQDVSVYCYNARVTNYI